MQRSWKTTLLGIGTILSAIGPALVAAFDADAATNPNWPVLITAITAGFGLIVARDNDKSSEAVGAK